MTGLNWDDDGFQEGLLIRRSAQTCLTPKEIEEYLFDRLSGVTREVIEEHLLVCQNCQDAVATEENYIGTFRSAARTVESEELDRAYNGTPEEVKPARAKWLNSLGLRWVMAGVFAASLGLIFLPRQISKQSGMDVTLNAERTGQPARAQAPAGKTLRLKADLTGLPQTAPVAFTVVDSTGREIHSAQAAMMSGVAQITIENGLRAGNYWVRIAPRGRPAELLREFGLQIR